MLLLLMLMLLLLLLLLMSLLLLLLLQEFICFCLHIQPHMIVLVVVAVCFTGLLRGVERPQGFTCAWSRPAFSLVTAESPSVATSRWENRVVPQAMVVVRPVRIFFGREMADVLCAALRGTATHLLWTARATGAGDSRTTARHGWLRHTGRSAGEAPQFRSPPAEVPAPSLLPPLLRPAPPLAPSTSLTPLHLSLPRSLAKPLSGGSSGSAQEWARFYR